MIIVRLFSYLQCIHITATIPIELVIFYCNAQSIFIEINFAFHPPFKAFYGMNVLIVILEYGSLKGNGDTAALGYDQQNCHSRLVLF